MQTPGSTKVGIALQQLQEEPMEDKLDFCIAYQLFIYHTHHPWDRLATSHQLYYSQTLASQASH